MDYDKLAESAVIQDVLQRVRQAGLHKVAAAMHNVDNFNVRVATEILGQRLVMNHARFSKTAAGLRALADLEASEVAKIAKVLPPPIPAKALMKSRKPAGGLFDPPSGPSPFSGDVNVNYTPKGVGGNIKPILSNEQYLNYLSPKKR